MPAYVALLYSIILPAGRVRMAALGKMATALGFEAPLTLLSSGNLVFGSRMRSVEAIEARLEAGFAERFGRHVDIIVREAGDWQRLTAANPFPEIAPAQIAVRVQRDRLGAEVAERLPLSPGDRVKVADGDLWMGFAGPPGQSRLLKALTPKRLGIGTSRGLGTVQRISALLAER